MFLYLHIQFHLKTSNDLEIYDMDEPSKDKLEEVCDLRQPLLFNFDNSNIINESRLQNMVNNFHAFDLKIRDVKDTTDSELYVNLPLHSCIKLFSEDTQSHYFSENNKDFLEETGLLKQYSNHDDFLRPYMVSNCNYDIMLGSRNTVTPLRYNVNYRNYFMVTQGSIKIKLATPQSIKYLSPQYDYENFEFKSPINVWNPQPKYTNDVNKVKFLEFTLLPGKTFYLPAYWWYSIAFLDTNTSVSVFNYRTYLNNLAISPYFALHALQLQNVKRTVVKSNQTPFNVHENIDKNVGNNPDNAPGNTHDNAPGNTHVNNHESTPQIIHDNAPENTHDNTQDSIATAVADTLTAITMSMPEKNNKPDKI